MLASVWLVAGTEALSLVHALRPLPLLLWWLTFLVALAAAARRLPVAWRPPRLGGVEAVLLAATFATLALLGVVSAATAPNNLDSLVYALPRQVMWMQAGGVGHFAADRLRQLSMPPLAEFAGLHLMILSGGDRFANLVQWLALGASAVVASVVVRDLGGGRVVQLLAALLVVTIPPAALQALNSKNDVVLGLWALVLGATFVRIVRDRRFDMRDALVGGAALGLAVLTKGTALPIMAPLALATLVAAAVVQRTGVVARLVLAGAIALALNAGQFARNYAVFGAPFGADRFGGFGMTNEIHTPAAIASNLVRNVALHLGTPSAGFNRRLTVGVERIHKWLGISSLSRKTSIPAVPVFAVELVYDEDRASAPFHVVAGALLLVALAWGSARGRLSRAAVLYAALPVAAFVAFCVGLRWQPWGSRLHVPMLLLMAPATALAVSGRRERIAALVLGGLAVAALVPFLLDGRQKPLADGGLLRAGRLETMLRPWPELVEPLRRTAAATAELGPRVVGLHLAIPFGDLGGMVEYPVQRTLLDAMPDGPRFVFPWASVASQLRDRALVPDAIVAAGPNRPVVVDPASGARFVLHAAFQPYMVYRRAD